jgi:hypothetical protein
LAKAIGNVKPTLKIMNYSSLHQGKSAVRVALVGCLLLTSAAMANPSSPDLDRDGIPNIADPDVDNDGLRNGIDRNIDGGVARSGPLRGRKIGDSLPNNSPAELDMDGDGLLDNAREETDIDGDALEDGSKGEFDTDGDGLANGLDGDVDGDGVLNASDKQYDGTSVEDDIFFERDNPSAYLEDASVADLISRVDAQLRKVLQIPANDRGLRVRVSAGQTPGVASGVWRYFSADQMQVWARWRGPADDPSRIQFFVEYQYTGPRSGNSADYLDPSNYSVSQENRLVALYPRGPITFVGWLPGEPLGFYYTAPGQEATGIEPPVAGLTAALRSYANFWNEGTAFSGDIAPTFTGILPIIQLERTLLRVTRAANGVFEARELARSMR